MSVYTGHLLSQADVHINEWSVDLGNYSVTAWSLSDSGYDSRVPVGGSRNKNQPVQIRSAKVNGGITPSFFEDFYNRIHINPTSIDVENLVVEEDYTVEVWNSYFVSKILNSINEMDTDGIVRSTPTPPTTYNALTSQNYTFTVGKDGPTEIDALYMFDFDGSSDDVTLSITGARLVAFPYPFDVPVRETLEWKTDIIESNDGSEQRSRGRKKPRQGFSVTYPIQPEESARAENLAWGWVGSRWAIPLWTEAQQVGSLSSGALLIPIDTTAADFRDGSLILIWESARVFTTVEVSTVAAASLTLSKALAQGFTNPWVMPVRTGKLTSGRVRRATSGHDAVFSFGYEVDDNIDLDPAAPADQFLGHDLYFDEILKTGDRATDDIFTRVDDVDYGTAPAADFFSPWNNSKIRRPVLFWLDGMSEIWAFRSWLHRRAGKLRPYWLPTFENNLRVSQTGLLSDTVEVYADDYKEFAGPRKHIAFKLLDDTWILRTIQSTIYVSDDILLVTLDSAININVESIEYISFLGLKRLDSDRVELLWNSNRQVKCRVGIVEIEP